MYTRKLFYCMASSSLRSLAVQFFDLVETSGEDCVHVVANPRKLAVRRKELPAWMTRIFYCCPHCVLPENIHTCTSPMEGIFLTPPHPSGNSKKASYISLYFLILQIPPSPGNSNPFCGGSMDIFLNCTLRILTTRCRVLWIVIRNFQLSKQNYGIRYGVYQIAAKSVKGGNWEKCKR